MGEDMDWTGQSGAVAWHLIFRHAEDWSETGDMMEAWARAYCGQREDALTARVAELEAALKLIADTDPVDAALDPQRAIRVAAALLSGKERS